MGIIDFVSDKTNDTNPIILIPTYQPGKALVESTNKLVAAGYSVVVVDDGSENQYQNVFDELNKKNKTSIILITHDIGQIGKYASKLMYLEQSILFYGSFLDFCNSDKMNKLFGPGSQHIICHQHD